MTQDQDAHQATYRRTFLAALRDADNAHPGFGNILAQLVQLNRAEAKAARSRLLNSQCIAAGTSAIIHQRDVERQRLPATIAVEQSQALRPLSYIAINDAFWLR